MMKFAILCFRDESETLVQKTILDELELRKENLTSVLTDLKTESEEIWKSMETAEKTLSEMVGCNDFDTTRFFVEEDRSTIKESETIILKQKADRKETEDFYTMVYGAARCSICPDFCYAFVPFSEISRVHFKLEQNSSTPGKTRQHSVDTRRQVQLSCRRRSDVDSAA